MDDQRLQVSRNATGQPVRRVGFPVKRVVPLVALAAAAAAVFALGLDDYLTFEALRKNRHLLMDFVAGQATLAVVLYLLIYAASTATSLPGGAILTVAGGFLFGPWLGTAYVVVAATVGATVVFLVARSTIGNILRAKAEPALRKMERGFRDQRRQRRGPGDAQAITLPLPLHQFLLGRIREPIRRCEFPMAIRTPL